MTKPHKTELRRTLQSLPSLPQNGRLDVWTAQTPNMPTQRISPIPIPPRQFSIAFGSTGLLGLSVAERRKAITHLARLLLLAAGAADEEHGDER
jgi:hypothetical protein